MRHKRILFTVPLLVVLALFAFESADADDWPQWRGPKRDGVYRESGVVERIPTEVKFKWKARIGAGYAGPSVAGNRIYVTDRLLDEGERNPENPFARSPVGGRERVLCLDDADGKVVWKHEYPCRYTISYPSGPRATPTVHEGKVYTVGVMGDMFCLDAATGRIVWSKDYVDDYGTSINVWGMSAAPLIDGKKVILLVGGKDGAGVVALDKESGAEVWRSLDVEDPGYCPPAIFEVGGKPQLIIWTPQFLAGLEPQTGDVLWKQPFQLNSNLSIASPIFDGDTNRLFVTAFYNGPLMMQLDAQKPAAKLAWKGKSDSERKTDILHGLMCTPAWKGRHIYGVGSYGELRCVEADTGKRVWESFAATGNDRWWNAFLVRHGDRFLISNEQGELITAELTPKGYKETGRAKIIDPTNRVRRRKVVWSHPAFANRSAYIRNDGEIVCVDLAAASYK